MHAPEIILRIALENHVERASKRLEYRQWQKALNLRRNLAQSVLGQTTISVYLKKWLESNLWRKSPPL
jgi:hypothetical protein